MSNNDGSSQVVGFLSGMLIGGLAATCIALLTAPQSGRKTRALIRQKGDELLDQVAETVDDARLQTEQAMRQGRRVTRRVGARAKALQQRGQALIEEQWDRLETTLEALPAVRNGRH